MTVIEIDQLAELEHEVFGPVLHVLRYDRRALADLPAQINDTGYGLTDAPLLHGPAERVQAVLRQVALRPGPIVAVTALAPAEAAVPLERLVIERSLSINTAAVGGNASLMTLG